jgi:hypothetical protein
VITRVARQLGIGTESLRSWVRQAEVDGGHQPGTSTQDKERIAALEREVRELRRANEGVRDARRGVPGAGLEAAITTSSSGCGGGGVVLGASGVATWLTGSSRDWPSPPALARAHGGPAQHAAAHRPVRDLGYAAAVAPWAAYPMPKLPVFCRASA